MKKSLIALLAGITALSFTVAVPAFSQETPTQAEVQGTPWSEMFPTGLIKAGQKAKAAKKENLKLLSGKFVGIYSSALWCGPCRMFTPELVKFYKKHKDQIEIVFNSSDHSEKEMLSYVKKDKMKWLAIPFGKKSNYRPRSGGIPNLVVFSPDGEVFAEISGSSRETPDPRLKDLSEKMDEWLKESKKTDK